MKAYIVGMIVGGFVTVSPLIYMMNVDRCVAGIIEDNPEFDPAAFAPSYSPGLATGITIIGAVVLLVSVGMMAFTGMGELSADGDDQSDASDAKSPGSTSHSSTPPSSEPETKADALHSVKNDSESDDTL